MPERISDDAPGFRSFPSNAETELSADIGFQHAATLLPSLMTLSLSGRLQLIVAAVPTSFAAGVCRRPACILLRKAAGMISARHLALDPCKRNPFNKMALRHEENYQHWQGKNRGHRH